MTAAGRIRVVRPAAAPQIGGMNWRLIARAAAAAVVLAALLYVPVRLFRYEPLMLAGEPVVLDRWRQELCTIAKPSRCFPVRR